MIFWTKVEDQIFYKKKEALNVLKKNFKSSHLKDA